MLAAQDHLRFIGVNRRINSLYSSMPPRDRAIIFGASISLHPNRNRVIVDRFVVSAGPRPGGRL